MLTRVKGCAQLRVRRRAETIFRVKARICAIIRYAARFPLARNPANSRQNALMFFTPTKVIRFNKMRT